MTNFKHGQHVIRKDDGRDGIAIGIGSETRIIYATATGSWLLDYNPENWGTPPANIGIGQYEASVQPTEHGPDFRLEVTPKPSTGEYFFTVLVDGENKCGNVVPMQPEERKEDLAQATVHIEGAGDVPIVYDEELGEWMSVRTGTSRAWGDWCKRGIITLGW